MPDYGPLYQAAGTQFGVDPLLLQSLATEESTENPNAVGPMTKSGMRAGGLFQFMSPTAQQYGVNVADANSSAYGAANYLNDLLNQHNQDLRAALATYGNTTPNSQYVKNVIDRYTGLTNAWKGRNFQAPASVPNTFDNEQPESTAAASQNTGPLTYTQVPAAKAAQQSPEDILRGLRPDTPSKTAPSAPAAPQSGSPDPATQLLQGLQPQMDEHGKPINTEQSLTAATSPGAKAVGMTPAEGRVPGPEFQAAINLATDPAQRIRIAAERLGIPQDRIIMHGSGRLAAVDDNNGRPYFIEPSPVFTDTSGITRGEPGTPWEPTSSFAVAPYSRAAPLVPGSLSPGNLARAVGAAAPAVPGNLLTMGAAGLGGPVTGGLAAGGVSLVTQAARQAAANLLDPHRYDLAPNWINSDTARTAGVNALLAGGGQVRQHGVRSGSRHFAGKAGRTVHSVRHSDWSPPFLGPGTGIPITRREPYGNQDILAPWEAPQRWELPPTAQPSGSPVPGAPPSGAAPSSPVPAEAPASTPPPVLVPGGAAGVALAEEPPSLTSRIKTQADAEARADELIRHYYAGGNTTPDLRPLVEGHQGTLAQITDNAGGASLERTLRNEPPLANTFGEFDRVQSGAGQNAVLKLRGTMEDFKAADAAVNRATAAKKASTFSDTTPTSVEPTIGKIDELLGSPEAQGNPDIAAGLRETRDLFNKTDPRTGKPLLDQAGNPVLQTDPETLYMVRRTINDKISGLARDSDSKIRYAAGQLGPVKAQLDADIAAGAPEYPSYIKQVSEQKKPIEGQEYLLGRTLTNSAGEPTLGQVNATLRDIENQRYLKSGWQSADALTQDQLDQLYSLRDALQQKANLQKGRALGSNTAQNILASSYNNALMTSGARAAGQAAGGVVGGVVGGFLDPLTGGMGGATIGAPLGIGAARWIENKLIPETATGDAMLRKALLDRVLNINGKGVRALSGGP